MARRGLGRAVVLGGLLVASLAAPAAAVEYVAFTMAAEQNVPRVCFGLTASLGRPEPGDLAPYVRVEPAADVALAARGSDLCVSGLSHGASYTVTLRAGLPAADGTRLAADVRVALRVPDRTPQLAFRSTGYVLPLKGAAAVPLTSVNVDRVLLKVLRIGARNIVPQLMAGATGHRLDVWAQDRLSQVAGEEVFSGRVEIEPDPNREVTTALPIGELVGTLRPGLYVVTAEPEGAALEDWDSRATQWLTVSDLGVTALTGRDGLTAIVRSLATAEPVAGASLSLIARNNEVLGTARTDADGRARFAGGLLRGAGGNAARALLAEGGEGDLTYIDLDGARLDLADRGLDGRTPPGALDAFVYTERGIYRPGETVHAAVLLRDDQARAVQGLPLSLRVIRPDAMEVDRLALRPEQAGGVAVRIPLAQGAYGGQWTLQALVGDGGAAIGETSFLVDDFVPPRLELSLAPAAARALAGEAVEVGVQADWLYGAPAGGLDGEAELEVAADPAPFPALEGYSFGLAQEPFLPLRAATVAFRTAEDGKADVALEIQQAVDTTQPLKAKVRARVFDVDGRPVEAEAALPLTSAPWLIGIRPAFTGSLAEGSEAAFELAAVLPDGTAKADARLAWELVREEVDYLWFERWGQWDYEIVVTDERLDAGELTLGPDGRGRLAVPVDAGRYRIELYDAESGVASSLRFTAGWWATAEASDRPDQVEVRMEPGAGVPRVFVKPPFDARVLLVLADSAVRQMVETRIGRDGGFVDLPGWETGVGGAYVLATAYAATGEVSPRLPARAVGAAWLPGPLAERRLEVMVEAPASIRPETRLEAVVRIADATAGDAAFVTLAAVDDAILGLTGFAAPDPADFFLGKRRLGIDLRDLYGRLIDPAGRRGRIVSGGDQRLRLQLGAEIAGRKPLSLFEGPVAVSADGTAHIAFDIPDFNGRLRLMAVAWDGEKVGGGETTLTVRPPLVADLTLPRFLAPGDAARLRLRLTNLEAPAGAYAARLATTGPLFLEPGEAAFADIRTGATGEAILELRAGEEPGDGTIELAVAGPDGFAMTRRFELSVRPDQPYLTRRMVALLEPGQSLTLDRALAAGLLPGTGRMSLALGTAPTIDVDGIARELGRYPYACGEQIISRATVGLYASHLGLPPAGEDATVQTALRRLVNLQAARGAIGEWSALDGDNLWLTAYGADFFLAAQREGVPVPQAPLDAALGWLAQAFARAGDGPTALAGAAYAAEVLARAGRLDLSNLRYFAERSGAALPSDLARAQLALAFYTLGDRARAEAVLATLGQGRLTGRDAPADYGSVLRDEAGLIAIAAPAGLLPADEVLARAERLVDRLAGTRWTSTQEQAWLLRAAAALRGGGAALKVALDGTALAEQAGPLALERPVAADMAPLVVENRGERPVYRSLTLTGIPSEPGAAESAGFRLARHILTPDGTPARLDAVRQNDQLVVLLEGSVEAPGRHRTLVVDLLAAGLETEDVRLVGTPEREDLAWLGELSTPLQIERRADRLVAALDLDGEYSKTFRVAYVVRATTPGRFRLPAAQVENMYRPELHARTAAGTLVVAPR